MESKNLVKKEGLMRLPEARKGEISSIHHICQEPGCKTEFFGNPIRKYCDFHTNPSNRYRDRNPYQFKNSINLILPGDFKSKSADLDWPCRMCGSIYEFRYIPGQKEYPAYCPKCRNLRKIIDFDPDAKIEKRKKAEY